MGSNYFRAPGAKVTYTSYETRNYVSRKARVSRGYYINPTRRERLGEGWRFWFFSPRGPAEDRGNWRVDAVRVDDEPPHGEDGHPNGTPGVSCGTDVIRLRIRAVSNQISGGSYVGGFPSDSPPTDTQSVAPHPNYSAYQIQSPSDTGTFSLRGFWPHSTVALYQALAFQRFYFVTGPFSGFSIRWVYCDYVTTDIQRQQTSAFMAAYGASNLGNNRPGVTQYVYEQTPLSPGSCDGSNPGGGGGAAPPGFLMGEGPWAYACSCPDFAHEELPYRVATAPTHRKTRSWGQIRPESPCKHIVSAARSLADQKTLVDWVRTFRADSPGRDFAASPTVAVDRAYNKAQREMEAAFRRTARATGLARAAANKQERAQRSARSLSNRLGRLWRLNPDGTTTSSSKKGRYGETLVGSPINWADIENTDTARTARAYQANVDEFIQRNGRIEPLDGIVSVADLFPTIATSSQFTPKDDAAIRYVRRSNR